jgi:type I restriction enzyme S subunit
MISVGVRLDEVALVNPKSSKRLMKQEVVSFIGMADADADAGRTSGGLDRAFEEVSKGYTQFKNGDILVAKITPCFENGKIVQASLNHEFGSGSTEFHVIRPDRDRLNDRYLLHFLRQPKVRADGERRMTGTAGQRRVPEAFFAELEIPIVSLDEQRRIADQLDFVQGLREKRHCTASLLDKLAQSVFFDMFGDSGGRWPELIVEEISALGKGSIRTGPFGSQLLHSEFVDSGIAVLGIDNAVANEFRWAQRRFITEEKYQKLSRYTVHPGDVIITIMGTCGRCAVIPDEIPTAINTKHLCCITLDQDKCLPEYLHSYFLWHPTARSYLHKTAKGAIMSGLNMSIIAALPVAVPPISLQQTYVKRAAAMTRLKERQTAHLAEVDKLFTSLQDRAFHGGHEMIPGI